jgi:hypothetical protein
MRNSDYRNKILGDEAELIDSMEVSGKYIGSISSVLSTPRHTNHGGSFLGKLYSKAVEMFLKLVTNRPISSYDPFSASQAYFYTDTGSRQVYGADNGIPTKITIMSEEHNHPDLYC